MDITRRCLGHEYGVSFWEGVVCVQGATCPSTGAGSLTAKSLLLSLPREAVGEGTGTFPATTVCGPESCIVWNRSSLPGERGKNTRGVTEGFWVPSLRKGRAGLPFIYTIFRQNNCCSSGRIMFVFMGVFKEGNPNKSKQRERGRERETKTDFERFRKRAVKWAPAS